MLTLEKLLLQALGSYLCLLASQLPCLQPWRQSLLLLLLLLPRACSSAPSYL